MDQLRRQVAMVYPKTKLGNRLTTYVNIPYISPLGACVKVVCAGLCHRMSPSRRSTCYDCEVSGIIEKLGANVSDCGLTIGQRVIVYPEGISYDYTEYIVVPNVKYLVPIPESLSFCVAAMLPSGGLLAKTAISYANDQIKSLNHQEGKILVVGTEGVSLWAIKIACQQFSDGNIQIFVASRNDEDFWMANEILKGNVVQWDEKLYEEQLIERTISACSGLVDVVIDFEANLRSFQRSLRCLNETGVVLISEDVSYNLIRKFSVKAEERGQNFQVVSKESIEQLEELVHCVASGEIDPPPFTVFSRNSASEVVQKLSNCEVKGSIVLRFNDIQ